MEKAPADASHPDKFALRKVEDPSAQTIAGILNSINVTGVPSVTGVPATIPDSLESWINGYLQLAVEGLRSEAVAQKIALHLRRFLNFFVEAYGHDRISTCLRRDVIAWQHFLMESDLAHSTVNNHLASLSTFTTWVHAQAPHLFAAGDPAKGVGELGLPPLEPKALTAEQVRSLKSVCDRLERFHQLKGRRLSRGPTHPSNEHEDASSTPRHAHGRPWRDRAIVFLLLSTGLRREELVKLDIDQLEPNTPQVLRNARRARLTRVKGKGKTERTVFLSADARTALADYLQRERHLDAQPVDPDPSRSVPDAPQPSQLSRPTQPSQLSRPTQPSQLSRPTQPSRAISQASEQATAQVTGPLFLSAASIAARAADGRLSPQAINLILTQIGRWHDAEIHDPARHISPLRPHDLRHTFAFHLALATGADAYELERRLGHRSQRYIQRYTNPPEAIAAGYVEQF